MLAQTPARQRDTQAPLAFAPHPLMALRGSCLDLAYMPDSSTWSTHLAVGGLLRLHPARRVNEDDHRRGRSEANGCASRSRSATSQSGARFLRSGLLSETAGPW